MHLHDDMGTNDSLFRKFDNIKPGAIAKLIKDNDKQDARLIAALKVIESLKEEELDEIDADFYRKLVLKSDFKYANNWKGAVVVLESSLRQRGLISDGTLIRRGRTGRNRNHNQ